MNLSQRCLKITALWGALVAVLMGTACTRAPERAPSAWAASVSVPPSLPLTPYVDVTARHAPLGKVVAETDQKDFTLAFILADDHRCNPSWGNVHPLDDAQVLREAEAVTARGGHLVVASGGADGPYLENACAGSKALTHAYVKALDAVGSNRLDVDIEASIPVDRVNRALERLQRERGTQITYTLHVRGDGEGVDARSLQILHSAAKHGLTVTVNPLLMNFDYRGSWAAAMVSAARQVVVQMHTVWPNKSDQELHAMLGVTAMIGRNDSGMTTTQQDARALLTFARSHDLGHIGFWSLNRDNGRCPGGTGAAPDCSGLGQTAYAFTTLLHAFDRQPS